MMMEVSSPPEYASTTLFALGIHAPWPETAQSATQQHEQDGLLNMQAVLGLVEHYGLRRIHHAIGDLTTAMRRQAVHEQRMLGGKLHQLVVHLEATEDLFALGCLGF